MIHCKNEWFQVDLNITDETDTTDTDSVSDSFEDIDASGASEAIAIGNAAAQILHPEIYKKRTDFVNKDDYALYVRTHVQVGMTVKCCRTYEEVHEGKRLQNFIPYIAAIRNTWLYHTYIDVPHFLNAISRKIVSINRHKFLWYWGDKLYLILQLSQSNLKVINLVHSTEILDVILWNDTIPNGHSMKSDISSNRGLL